MFKHKYTEEEVRKLVREVERQVECEAFQRGVFMGYEYAQSGGILYIPKPQILQEFEEVASKYWEEK